MRLTTVIPYYLVGFLTLSLIALWISVSFQQTAFVQMLYIATIFLAFCVFLMAAWSAVSCALKRFGDYWVSGYPIMLATALLAYGMFKSLPQLEILAIFWVALLMGYLVGRRVPQQWERFVPLITIAAFVVVGEFSIWREGKAFVTGICVGLLTALIFGIRQRHLRRRI